MEAALSLTNSTALCSSSTLHPLAKPNLPLPTSLNWPGPAVKQPLLTSTHSMFRSMATLVLRNVAAGRRPHTGPDPEREDSDAEEEDATDGGEEEEEAKELECMEEAAMAGKDEGRAPDDYDRRAHIFNQSARVFQHARNRKDSGAGQ